MKTERINGFAVIYSTDTAFCVEISRRMRLFGKMHSDSSTGAPVWETHFEEKKAKLELREPIEPIINNHYFRVVDKWEPVKYTKYAGITLVKSWPNKKDIITALWSVPKHFLPKIVPYYGTVIEIAAKYV